MIWRTRTRLGFITLIVVEMGLIACSEKAPPPPAHIAAPAPAAVKPASADKLEVPPIFARASDYTYNPVGKRNPFQAYRGDLVQEFAIAPRSPLEGFDLEQLKVAAIVWGLSSPRALIQAPDNQSYIIRLDTRIGRNRGRISRITRREIFVKEEYRDPTGKLVVRESVLEIRPKEKEGFAGIKMSDEPSAKE